jgi:ribosomal protein S18 acetylase RimI-like enzyme
VRRSNDVAVELYKKLGYIVFRVVTNYYSGPHEEDAFGRIMIFISFQRSLVCDFVTACILFQM